MVLQIHWQSKGGIGLQIWLHLLCGLCSFFLAIMLLCYFVPHFGLGGGLLLVSALFISSILPSSKKKKKNMGECSSIEGLCKTYSTTKKMIV